MKQRLLIIVVGMLTIISTLTGSITAESYIFQETKNLNRSVEEIIQEISATSLNNDDIDPLVDLTVTVEIQQIRSLETSDVSVIPIDKIDLLSDPDFYVKVFINDQEYTSPVWNDMKYVYDPQWSATCNVPDEEEFVNITIQLWDSNPYGDKLCDLSDNYGDFDDAYDIDLQYNLEAGHWIGETLIVGCWKKQGKLMQKLF